MKRRLFLSILFLGLASGAALACDCMSLSPEKKYDNAAAVFIGKVAKTEQGETLIDVSASYKGIAKSQLAFSSQYQSDCDVGFKQSQEYIVFANMVEGKMQTSLCAGTALVSDVKEIVDWVRAHHEPQPIK